jgi:ATP-dependent Clp protease adaptor protein ClpS
MRDINHQLADKIFASLKNSGGNFGGDPMTMGDVITMEQTIVKTKRPSEWRVIIFNDDVSPLELVLVVLVTVFSKSEDEAINIMQTAESEGKAVIGVYSHDIAKTLINNAKTIIKNFEATFGAPAPLRIEMEEIVEE